VLLYVFRTPLKNTWKDGVATTAVCATREYQAAFVVRWVPFKQSADVIICGGQPVGAHLK
jgi:hypothetical protein